MDAASPTPSTLDTLRTVEFRLGLKGYNVDEVDEYLEKAAIEAEALQEQLRQAGERLRQASERIAQLETERRAVPAPILAAADNSPIGDSLQRTLLLAQKFVDQTKRESEAAASELIAQAEARARSTVAQAEERSTQLASEAEQRLRNEVARLEAMRSQLTTDVESLARQLDAERNRLRTGLQEVLKWVEENVQPATSLLALRAPGGDPAKASAPRPPAVPPRGSAPPPPGMTVPGGQSGAPQPNGGPGQVLDLRGVGVAGRPVTPEPT